MICKECFVWKQRDAHLKWQILDLLPSRARYFPKKVLEDPVFQENTNALMKSLKQDFRDNERIRNEPCTTDNVCRLMGDWYRE